MAIDVDVTDIDALVDNLEPGNTLRITQTTVTEIMIVAAEDAEDILEFEDEAETELIPEGYLRVILNDDAATQVDVPRPESETDFEDLVDSWGTLEDLLEGIDLDDVQTLIYFDSNLGEAVDADAIIPEDVDVIHVMVVDENGDAIEPDDVSEENQIALEAEAY